MTGHNEARRIEGKTIAGQLRPALREAADAFARRAGRRAQLDLVLVGEDAASQTYVRAKHRQADEAGITACVHTLPASTDAKTLDALIGRLNAEEGCDGILVQLPLPAGLDARAAIEAIRPEKDVDGFTDANAGRWIRGDGGGHVPCTPAGCLYLLHHHLGSLRGRHAAVIGRSMVVGRPMAALLLARDCSVVQIHSRTPDPQRWTREAEIVVAAAGRAEMIDREWVARGAVVVDVGIHRNADGSLCGDVDRASILEHAGAFTPVPGGVGPMTICFLLYNTLRGAIRLAGLEAEIALPGEMAPL